MNKAFIILLGLLFFTPIFSHAASCEGEAQIIAKVAERKTNSLTYCTAIVDLQSVEFYAESIVCPLSLEVVHSEGIQFPLENGHDCTAHKGMSINGVLVMKNGQIYLE